jgi:hypothetical protein
MGKFEDVVAATLVQLSQIVPVRLPLGTFLEGRGDDVARVHR